MLRKVAMPMKELHTLASFQFPWLVSSCRSFQVKSGCDDDRVVSPRGMSSLHAHGRTLGLTMFSVHVHPVIYSPFALSKRYSPWKVLICQGAHQDTYLPEVGR